MKRLIPLWITAVSGILLIVAYFIPAWESWGEKATIWFDVLAASAFVLGGGNLLKLHLRKVSNRQAGWAYSAVTVAAFVVTLTVGLAKIGVHPSDNNPDFAWSGSYNSSGTAFWWLYEYAFKPLTATMFSLLAFYVASAAFRAFRAKNIEATLLLGTAFIVLLGRTFAGVFLTQWLPESLSGLKLENLTVWIMQVPNTAGTRAIMIGVALGIASTSLKVLLGVDRSYLGSD
ncbi:MAG: hypothetical protein KDA22_16960 [Phycisphaerales bacterium]|nr:hypothetical protein [Phycisphaerales bacterium]